MMEITPPIKNLTAALEHLSHIQTDTPRYIELTQSPNLFFLEALNRYSHETALFRIGERWYAFTGMEDRFSPVWIPEIANAVIHCNGNYKGEKLSSPGDLAFCLEKAVNVIVHFEGITIFKPPKFKPILEQPGRPDAGELEAASRVACLRRDDDMYIEFLKRAGVEWKIIDGKDLTDERLREILSSNNVIEINRNGH